MLDFEKVVKTNVNAYTEKRKNGGVELTYLSWAHAWGEFVKLYPNAKYEVRYFADKDGVMKPFVFDENLGYMCSTSVTVDDLTHEMWLPVMNGANQAMKNQSYVYGQYKKTVEAATMFDINKTLMRCLTKNLAMFGLGLYIYKGEDLPENEKEEKEQEEKPSYNLSLLRPDGGFDVMEFDSPSEWLTRFENVLNTCAKQDQSAVITQNKPNASSVFKLLNEDQKAKLTRLMTGK